MAKRVLVIDDEEIVRNGFAFALGPAGYDVETAASGLDGIARARQNAPDLIFLDLRMPGMDGVETLRRLREFLPAIPIYIVTAFRRDYIQSLHQVVADGLPFDLLDKPLEAEQIHAVADSALGRPRAV